MTSRTASPDTLERIGRRSWSGLGVFLAVIAAVWLIPHVLLIIVPITAAGLVAALLRPLVARLESRGLPPLAATWSTLLLAAVVVAAVVMLLVPTVSSEFGALRTQLDTGLANIKTWLVDGPFGLSQANVDRWSTDLQRQVASPSSTLSQGALSRTPVVLHTVAGSVLTFVLSFYGLKDGPLLLDRLRDSVSVATATRIESAAGALGGYARGLVVNGIVNASVLGGALVLLGVPLALALAAITFVASFVPVAGAIVAGTLAALVALVASGPVTALIVIGVTTLIHHLEGYFVGPFIIGRSVGIHPVILILSVVVGSIVAGIPGAFLAGPFAAVTAGWIAAGRTDPDET